jgi:UDP-glucose 4-epimerase
MRVIVTGGAGFLGRATAEKLASGGHQVLAVDKTPARFPAGIEGRAIDITDQPIVEQAFNDFRPDAAVHLAALLTPASRGDIVAATRVNCLGTAIVLSAAVVASARSIVYASSVSALGLADPARGDATIPVPGNVYGATKAYAEYLAASYALDHPALSFTGLRFGWVFGPGRDRGWRDVQAVIEAAARGERRVIYPDYPDLIDWTWVGDAAEVAARAALTHAAGHRVFNVAGDKRRVREAADYLVRRFPGLVAEPIPGVTPPGAWLFANDGLAAAIGYAPKTRMEEGIDRLIESVAPGRAVS